MRDKNVQFWGKILNKIVEKFFGQMCSDEFFLKHALPVSALNESTETAKRIIGGDCSSTEDRGPRKRDRRSASSASAHVDRSFQVIGAVARMRRNKSQCSYRAKIY